MKKYKLLTLAMMAASALSLSAQTEFMPAGSTLQQAIDKARQEGKMVFLDCYTSWCGPCKMMATKILPMPEVGEFMNPKFVSIKIDMEKGEGPELAGRLEINAYPTFVMFNNDGTEAGRLVGGSDAAKFMKRVSDALADKTLPEMEQRFNAGERDRQFLLDYLDRLTAVRRKQQCNLVAQSLLEGQEATFAADTTLRKVFFKHVKDPYAPIFCYVHNADNRVALEKMIDRKKLDDNFKNVMSMYARKGYKNDENGNKVYDRTNLDKVTEMLKSKNVKGAERVRQEFLINVANGMKDWAGYVACMNAIATGEDVEQNDLLMCYWAEIVVKNCTDQAVLASLKSTLETRLADIKSGRRPEVSGSGKPEQSQTERMEKIVKSL